MVFDTPVEDVPEKLLWRPGNGPKTAVHAFLKRNTAFEIGSRIDKKLLITVAPDGFLKRVAQNRVRALNLNRQLHGFPALEPNIA